MTKQMKTVILVFSLMTGAPPAFAGGDQKLGFCGKQVEAIVEYRNELFNGVTGLAATLGFTTMFVPIAAVPVFGTGLVASGVFAIRSGHAENILAIYSEAARTGGRHTLRLYNKYRRRHPNLLLDYSAFLDAIHESDLNGESCKDQGRSLPRKAAILDAIDEG